MKLSIITNNIIKLEDLPKSVFKRIAHLFIEKYGFGGEEDIFILGIEVISSSNMFLNIDFS